VPGEVETLPLTFTQKLRLVFGALRLVLVLIPFALYAIYLTGRFGPPPAAFYILLIGVVLFVGYDSLRDLRDLLHGTVEVRDDVLIRSRAGSPGRHYRGHFQGLGKVRMSRRAHFGSQNGSMHRVTYSPVGKYVWSAEPKKPYA